MHQPTPSLPQDVYKLTAAEVKILTALVETTDPEVLMNKLRYKNPRTLRGRVNEIREKTGLPNSALPSLGKLILSGKQHPDYRELSEVLTCSDCKLPFNSTLFTFYPHDKRCKNCIHLASMTITEKRRTDKVLGIMKDMVKKSMKARPTIPAVEQLLNGVYDHLGGIDKFAESWAKSILKMQKESSGTNAYNNQCASLAKFHHEVFKGREAEKGITGMTKEELLELKATKEAELLAKLLQSDEVAGRIVNEAIRLHDPDAEFDETDHLDDDGGEDVRAG